MTLCLMVLYGLRPLSLPQYYVPRQDTVSHQARDFHLPPQRSGPTTAYGMHWGSVCFQPSQLIYHARNKQGSSELGWSGHMFGRIWWVLWWESPREARIIAKRLIKDKAWYFKYTSQIGRAHVWTSVTDVSRMPSSAWKKKKKIINIKSLLTTALPQP